MRKPKNIKVVTSRLTTYTLPVIEMAKKDNNPGQVDYFCVNVEDDNILLYGASLKFILPRKLNGNSGWVCNDGIKRERTIKVSSWNNWKT